MTLDRDIFRFDSYVLDCVVRIVYRDGEPLDLAANSVEALILLVRNHGRIVSEEELSRELWPNRAVDSANLSEPIAHLQAALFTAEGTEVIRAYSGRGYEFMLPFEPDPLPPEPKPLPPLRSPRRWILLFAALALMAAGAVWHFAFRSPAAVEWTRSPWIRLPGAKYHPALSRDGQQAAFAGTAAGGRGHCIFVARSGQASAEEVPDSCGEVGSPAWSPDGRQLAFLQFGTPQVGTPQVGTGGVRVLRHDFVTNRQTELTRLNLMPSLWSHRMLAWSPDGQWLSVSDQAPHGESVLIYRVSIDGRQRVALSAPLADRTVIDVEPTFSPDGRQVAFVRMINHQWRDVTVVDLSSGKRTTVAGKNRTVGGLDWSADSRQVIFSTRVDGDFRLFMVPVEGGPLAMHPAGIYTDSSIQFSVAGDEMAYTVSNQSPNIWRLDLAQRTWERWAASTSEDFAPQVSPDGRQVVFVSDRSGQEQLWLADRDGREVRRLTNGALMPGLGRWSPTSNRIVFNAFEPTTHYLDLTSGAVRQVIVKPPIILCAISPDGRSLIGTVTVEGHHRLIDAPIEGGRARTIAEDGFFGQYSPDGRWIYFVKDRQAKTLWRVSALGGTPAKVLDSAGLAGFGMWAVGRRELYRVMRRPDQAGWWIAKSALTANAAPTFVAPQKGGLPPFGAGFLTLSPDERHLWTVWTNTGTNELLEARAKPF